MAASQIQIEVRTLTGEATTVSASVNDTVSDLKLLLNRSFPPATNSPNFHLFFKGEKLRLQSQIGVHSIKPGEVLVLVPFVKKVASNNQSQKCDQSEPEIATKACGSMSKFANSTWSDMMQDLSYLRDDLSNGTPSVPNIGSFDVGDESRDCSRVAKRRRGFSCDDIILDILEASRSKSVLDEQNFRRLVEILELVNCLSYQDSGDCMLWRRKASLQCSGLGMHNGNGNSCLCPEWLKKIMKAFAFLNIFSALVQLQQERTTLTLLEQALEQLAKFGVKFAMQDMEHLSIISPKVVLFVKENEEETTSGNTSVIIKCPVEQNPAGRNNNNESACKQMDAVLKMQESSFRSNLWEAVERLMFIKRKDNSSLEDFLISVKECSAATRGNKVKILTASTTDSDKKHSAASTTLSDKKQGRCHRTDPLLPDEMVEHLRKRNGSGNQIEHVEDISARKAVHVEVSSELTENLRSGLHSIGITQLYSHQAESIQASLSGKNVVVATMTSSGKSLCYNLPVIEALSQSSSSCALYLFPTKALAQDQLRALSAMSKGFNCKFNIGIYDGDTNQQERTRLRHNARLLITNPDMLHVSILPNHRKFGRILANLRYVVIDEAHVYKGAFGCHTALILRRLRRLCSHVYGSDPSFVFSTATSANPREHCMELANLPTLELIQKDGSPAARKLFILWNSKGSAIGDISLLFAEMVQHGLRCIVFCKTRKLCELVFSYTREILQETAPHLVDTICSYRGGYIAEDRRRIENDLFNGKLCGIATTNALELGIDVGHIDVSLHLGFPGSIASLWQQAGRAGRRERPSLAVYVAFEGPLDQYFMTHPNKIFGSPIECCHVDAKNQQVLEQHLACAALEHPLSLFYDEKFFGPGFNSAILSLKSKGYLSYDPSCDSSAKIWNYIGREKMPSHSVSIRLIEREKYKVMDHQEKEIEEIEESKAFFQVYEGAVYLNQGKTYLVTSLDLSRKIAWCEEAKLNYYTKTRDRTDIHVVGGNVAYPAPAKFPNQISRTTAQADPCKVTTTWFGFYQVQKGSNVIFDKFDLQLPKYSYGSQAVWVPVPSSIIEAVKSKQLEYRAGLHAASHAVLHIVPLRIICNLSDLAPECADPNESSYFPERILLYDRHPGGLVSVYRTAISLMTTFYCAYLVVLQIQPVFMELLATALELLTSCHCGEYDGCPNCIQSFCCRSYNEVLHKDAAIMIIKGLLDANMQINLPNSPRS